MSLELALGVFSNVGYQSISKTLLWCSSRLQEFVEAPENCHRFFVKSALYQFEVAWYVVTRGDVIRSMISAIHIRI